jgi:hypothetical protein
MFMTLIWRYGDMEISATATVALTLQTSSTVPTSGTTLSTMNASDNIGIGECYNVDDYVITFYNYVVKQEIIRIYILMFYCTLKCSIDGKFISSLNQQSRVTNLIARRLC